MTPSRTWYGQLLQALPHFDLSFHTVDPTFNPFNTKYIESIIFWAAVPVLLLLSTLLIFLVYFCSRCCRPKETKQTRKTCLTASIIIIVLLTCGAISVGFYGNQVTTKSIQSQFKIVDRAFTVGDSIKAEVDSLHRSSHQALYEGLDGIQLVIDSHPELATGIRDDLKRHTEDAIELVKQIQGKVTTVSEFIPNVNLGPYRRNMDTYEFIRWLVMLVLLSCFTLVSVVAAFAIGASSRVLLMIFVVLGIISLVLCYLLTSAHFALTVVMSDFCRAPTDFIIDLLPTPAERDAMNYFLKCDANAPNPLNSGVQSALGLLKNANSTVHTAQSMAEKFIGSSQLQEPVYKLYGSISEIGTSLIRLVSLLHCNLISQLYRDVTNNLCATTLSGILLILLSCCVTGFLLSILILMALRACRIVGLPRSFSYNLVLTDTDDYCQGRQGDPSEGVKVRAVHRRTTPPPSMAAEAQPVMTPGYKIRFLKISGRQGAAEK